MILVDARLVVLVTVLCIAGSACGGGTMDAEVEAAISGSVEDGTSSTSVSTTSVQLATSTTRTTRIASTTSTTIVMKSLVDIVEGRYQGGVGAVIVGMFGETAVTAAAGVDGDGRPVAVDRPWMTASLAKVITATAVLQIVEGGGVDMDAPVAGYVDFPMSDRITVRHVMQHKSTIPNMFSHIGTCTDESTVEEIKQRAGTEPVGVPGEVSEYSNTNYLVLGLLIEAVTGQDPGDYVKENIFEPLGMDSTYWYESQEGPAPWWPDPASSQGVSIFDCGELGRTVGTDGAVVTTLQDMDSFYSGLFGGVLITDETLQSMIQMDSQVFGLGYGLGIMELADESRPDDVLYGHSGDAGWYQTAAFHDPVKGRSVVVFTTFGNEYSLLFETIDWANQQTD